MKFVVLSVTVLLLGVSGYFYYPKLREDLKWDAYFARVGKKKAYKFVKAHFKAPGNDKVVIDLGAGNGNETLYLLNRGFKVIAVDFQEQAIERIRSRIPEDLMPRLTLIHDSFENLDWEKLPELDGVVAINSLSFLEEKDFDPVWTKISSRLKPEGVVVAKLFGKKTVWPNMNHMTFVADQELTKLEAPYSVVEKQENYYEKGDGNKEHVYSLVLKKQA